MSWALLGPVAGYMPGLSDAGKAEIARRFPSLPIDQISACLAEYLLFRKARAAEPTAAAMLDEIEQIRLAAERLTISLTAMSNLASRYIQEAGLISQRPVNFESLLNQLAELDGAAKFARQRSPKGRRVEPRTMLVRSLAIVLDEHGLQADQRPTGPLVTVADIVLREAGEAPGDVRRIVQQALRKWQVRLVSNPEVAS